MTTTASAKVVRLLTEGRVMPAGTASAYDVRGDHGTYRVIVGDGWTQCPCPAHRELCSHAESALLLHWARVDGVEVAVALRQAEATG